MRSFRHHLPSVQSDRATSLGASGIIRFFLYSLSLFYEGAHRLRNEIYRRGWRSTRRLSCPVVSIGNLVAGGTGKTPMTQYLARYAQRLGYRPVILSRGYKGRAERKGGIVGDGRAIYMTPEAAGDEPYMLAASLNGVPVIVGQDRYRSGCLAVRRFNPDLILLDDGFQHIRLARDLDILLLDGRRPLGDGYLLPRGLLREPPPAIQRADAVVLTRSEAGRAAPDELSRHVAAKPIFHAFHRPFIDGVLPAGQHMLDPGRTQPDAPEEIGGRRVFAFSAIAQNDDFLRSVARLQGRSVGHQQFYDHYRYTRRDISAIGRQAMSAGAECLATTSKDFARIGGQALFPLDLIVVTVNITFNRADFDHFITASLANLVRGRAVGLRSA